MRNLFGNVTSGLIRLAVTGGILFLAYLFILKPILDTTNEAIERSGIGEIGKSFEDFGPQLQRQIQRSIRTTSPQGAKRQRLIRCIQRADRDVKRIQRCTRKY